MVYLTDLVASHNGVAFMSDALYAEVGAGKLYPHPRHNPAYAFSGHVFYSTGFA
jgi:hypothetical protein